VKNIELHVNDRLKLDGHLTVGGVAENVEVSAGQALVQPIAALQSTMTSTQVKELPLNNRNFVQLATLAPGVSSDLADEVGVGLASTVSMSINGSRRNAVNWLVTAPRTSTSARTSRCSRHRASSRSRSSRSSPTATRPSGPEAAAASSTS